MTDLSKLREVLLRSQRPLFAVLDGAQFPDLPTTLSEGDFFHRSLYRKSPQGNPDQDRCAPQLVWLDHGRYAISRTGARPVDQVSLDRLIDLIDGKHACVFWECAAGGESLYHHLRKINVVLFPKDARVDQGKSYEADPRPSDEKSPAQPVQLKRVILRHSDPNVMAQIIPTLSQGQYLRLLGPANAIIFQPDKEWGESIMRASRKDGAVPAPRGLLAFNTRNIDEIEDQRRETVVGKRVAYLRKVAPDFTAARSDVELRDLVRRQDAQAEELGLELEYSRKLWAFMMLISGEKSGQIPEVRAYIRSGPKNPDQNFAVLFNKTKSVVRVHRRAG
ncbi:DUF4123 domain-containing protein [Agrobacterium rosae]|uniref:DUF4123 domain-containing protein n=1 Tax=Agrobacterium rosae TaxID=1972867 RepID=A0AAW9FN19_9HYPH|nr:DUF4123 domain-containing protein [Agrobacterium rosae]MDX8305967.1 hypothetical protein [Agrobacterium rosae]